MNEHGDNSESSKQPFHTTSTENNNHAIPNNSDEDEMVFAYIVPHASPKTQQRRLRQTIATTDEDSNVCFMSEPSLSEDTGDSDSRIRAPHRNTIPQQQQSPSLPEYENDNEYTDDDEQDYQRETPNRFFSSSEEELLSYSDTDQQTEYHHHHHRHNRTMAKRSQQNPEPLQQQQLTITSVPLQQQEQQNQPSQSYDSQPSHVQQNTHHHHHRRQLIRRREQNSPGNTSLSSWDSPATTTHKKVLLQFVMPESKYAKAARLQREQQQLLLQQPELPQTRQPRRVSSPDNKPDELPTRQQQEQQQSSQSTNDNNDDANPDAAMEQSSSPSSSFSFLSHSNTNPVTVSTATTTRQPAFVRKAKNLVGQYWQANHNNNNSCTRNNNNSTQQHADPESQPTFGDENNDDAAMMIVGNPSFDDSIPSTVAKHSRWNNGESEKKEDTVTTSNKKNGDWSINNKNNSRNGPYTTAAANNFTSNAANTVRTNPTTTIAPGNLKKKQEPLFVFPSIIQRRMRNSSVDDSVNMTLSDSEAGDMMMMGRYHHDSRSSSSFVLRNTMDWEGEGYHSADDEKTAANARPRTRIKTKPTLEHRRSRSGDGAAATLVTGGTDWKGMEQDKIPFPIGEGDDDDDESANRIRQSALTRRTQRFSRAFEGKPQKKQKIIPTEQPEPRKQVSKSSIVKYPPLPARCPVGNYGTLPPVPDTDRDLHSKAFQFERPKDHAWTNPMTQSEYAQFSTASLPYYEYSSGFNTVMNGNFRKDTDDADSSEMSSGDDNDESDDDDVKGAEAPPSLQDVRLPFNAADTLDHLEHLYEDRRFRAKSGQTVLRGTQSQSPFANIGKPSAEKAPRSAFLPTVFSDDANYPT
jgi:hypothetical protein